MTQKPAAIVAAAAVLISGLVGYLMIDHDSHHPVPRIVDPTQTRTQDQTPTGRSTTLDDYRLSELLPLSTPRKITAPIESYPPVPAVEQENSGPDRSERAPIETTMRTVLSAIQSIAQRTDTFYLHDALSEQAEHLRLSPRLVRALLAAYPDIASEQERELLSWLLASTKSLEVEQYAIEQLAHATTDQDRLIWTKLLRDTGVRSESAREILMAMMPSITDPTQLSAAVQAIAPQDLALDQRTRIAQSISSYLQHPNNLARNAVIHAAAEWADEQAIFFIEQAMMDPSSQVRETAVAADAQSPTIKNMLLSIMQDHSEPLLLRERSYLALTNYELRGFEQEALYAFHQTHIKQNIEMDKSQTEYGANHSHLEDHQ